MWDELGGVESRMRTLAESMAQLRERLRDVRENLKVLGTKGNRDLRRKLAGTMAALEAQLNDLNRKWVELNIRKGELRRRLHALLKSMRYRGK